MEPKTIEVRNAREHNLRSVTVSLPRNALIVFTGVSGSGKSSLAFDTLYAEGQRRYIESLSSYARQFMGQMPKPDCDLITGLSPAVSIQQKATGWNPRSTVGTVTAIYDYLRVLFARIGTQHCTACNRAITAQSRDQIVGGVLSTFAGISKTRPQVLILAPVARGQKGEFRDLFDDLVRDGYVRARVDGTLVDLHNDLALARNQRHDIEVVIDRIAIDPQSRSRLAEAVENGLRVGNGTVVVTPAGDRETPVAPNAGRRKNTRSGGSEDRVFSSHYACTRCSLSFEPPTPQMLSFNSPAGMCPTCDGLGELTDFDPDLMVPDPSLNFWSPCIAPMRTRIGRWRRHIYEGVAQAVGIDLSRKWNALSNAERHTILYGTGDRHIAFAWKWSGGMWRHGGTFDGIVGELREKYRKATSSFVRRFYEKFMRKGPCTNCKGSRLTPQAAAIRLPTSGKRAGPAIHELCALSVTEVLDVVDRIELTPVQHLIADEVLKEVRTRLQFLLDVGLHYMALNRPAPTLSGGESQRIRLAGQIGSGLAGVLYILDEPSIGLHARDNQSLLKSLIKLRDLGNTVVVVEHDEATMRAADYLVDFGPGPGVRGGRVVAAGSFEEIVAEKSSITGRYLSGRSAIDIPKRRPVLPRKSESSS